MKKLLLLLVFLSLTTLGKSQCNTDVSICTPGVAGPFNFIPASQVVGTCQDFLAGINAANYAYILLNITQSGPLSLLIDGNGSSGYIDVSVFKIPGGQDPCQAIQNNANEIGCNYASYPNGCNQFGNYFGCTSTVPAPNVVAGDLLMIIVEDWSSAQNTFTLQLGPVPNAQTGPYDATINQPAAPYWIDPPFAVTSVTGGGSWTASCGACINQTTGVFNPEIAGIGFHTICHDGGASPCDGNDCIVLEVLDPCILTLTPSSTNVLCKNASNGTASMSPNGAFGNVTYVWNSGQTTGSITGLAPGTYNVTGTDSLGCTATSSVVITEPTKLLASNTTVSATCTNDNGQVTVTASGGTSPYTYSWAHDAALTTATITGLATGTYICTVRDKNGCTVQTVANVGITGVVSAAYSYNGNQCIVGNSYVFTNQGTPAVATYFWDFDDGTSSTSEDPVHTFALAGSYDVKFIISAGGCTDSITQTILVYDMPTSTISGTDPLCNGDANGTINLTPSNGTAPYAFFWSNSAITEDLNNLIAGNYSVTITDNNGCQATNNFTLINPPVLSATASSTDAQCEGVCDGTGTAAPTGGTAPYSYIWSDPAAQTNITATGLCDGTHSVQVSDANNCTVTASTSIANTGAISVTTSSVGSTCTMSNGSATASPSAGVAPYFYLWTPTGLTTQSISGIPSGTYSVLVTDTDGCQVTGTEVVTDVSDLALSISSINHVACYGNNDGRVTVAASGGAGGYSYVWSPGGQTGPTNTALLAGVYTVTVTDASGCTANMDVTITQPAEIVLTLSSVTSNCSQSDGSVNVVATGGTVAVNYSYLWKKGVDTAGVTASVNGLSAGTYTLLVSDDYGCSKSGSISVGNQPGGTVSATKTDISCFGLCNGSGVANMTGGTLPISYVWNNPTSTTGPNVSSLCSGTYTVNTTDAVGCTSSTSITIVEPGLLTISNVGQSDASCYDFSDGNATVFASGGTTPYTYLWNDPSAQTTAAASSLSAGGYVVTVNDARGCQKSLAYTINHPDEIVLSLSDVDAHCSLSDGSTEVIVVSGGIGTLNYSWSSGSASTVANNVGPGYNVVTVTDGTGCSVVDSINVGNIPAGTFVITNKVNPSCYGLCDGAMSLSISGTGTAPYNFSWTAGNNPASQNVTGLCTGVTNVTITDASGCVVNVSGELTEPFPVNVGLNSSNLLCYGQCTGSISSSVSGGTPPYSYAWNDPLSQNTHNAVNLCAGVPITLVVTDVNGCQGSKTTTLSQPTQLQIDSTVQNASCELANGSTCVTISGGITPYNFAWGDGQTDLCKSAIYSGSYSYSITDANGCDLSGFVIVGEDDGPIIDFVNLNEPTCLGDGDGRVTATPLNGIAPFTYIWDAATGNQNTPTATNLSAGTYSVVVTDNVGCSGAGTVTIADGNFVQVNASKTDPACKDYTDGQITAIASGGTAPYTYLWSDGTGQTGVTATGLSSGTYTVIITDNDGCTGSNSFSLNNPSYFGVSGSKVNLNCFNECIGSATVSPINGFAPITVVWNDINAQTSFTATNLCAGTYRANLTDAHGCQITAELEVEQPSNLILSATAVSHVTCFGMCNGFITVSANGGVAPYTYNWVGGATGPTRQNLCPGTYTVSVTDANGCVKTLSVNITQPTPLTAGMALSHVDCYGNCNGVATYTVSGGTPPYSYQWFDNLLQTTAAADSLCAGTYTIVANDNNGCTISSVATITQPLPLVLYGNVVDANCGQSNGKVCVSTAGGTPPFSFSWNDANSQTTACAINIPSGTRIVNVTDANGCLKSGIYDVADIAAPVLVLDSLIDITCNGLDNGRIYYSVSGGATPYSDIEWFNGSGVMLVNSGQLQMDSLPEGCYSIEVVDAGGCRANKTNCIQEPSLLNSLIVDEEDAKCYEVCDGSARLFYIGGTAPYSILWDDGQTDAIAVDLCDGVHYATVTDNRGCTSSDTSYINQPTELLGSLNYVINANCSGSCDGIMQVTFSGGVMPYLYSWDQGSSQDNYNNELCAGGHIIIATDANGCSKAVAGSVGQPTPVSATFNTVAASCNLCNGIASAMPTGGIAPYTYSWEMGQTTQIVTGLCGGLVNCTVADAQGCTFEQIVSVSQSGMPVIDSIVINRPSCFEYNDGAASIFVSNGAQPYVYNWNPSQQTAQTAILLTQGVYCVNVTDAKGCVVSDCFEITHPSKLESIAEGGKTICNGQTTNFWGMANGGTAPYTFNWESPYQDFIGGGPHYAALFQSQPVCFTVADANGCSTPPACVDIIVLPALQAVASPDTLICENDVANLSAIASGGGTVNYTYKWFSGGNFSAILSQNQSFSPIVTDSLWFYVELNDGCSAAAFDSVLVNTDPAPVGFFTTIDPIGCVPAPTDFVATSDIGVQYEWDFQCDGTYDTVSYTNFASFFYQDYGLFDVCLKISSDIGCNTIVTEAALVTVNISPVADFNILNGEKQSILNPVAYVEDVSIDANQRWWDFNQDWVVDDSMRTSSFVYNDTGIFYITLIVENEYQCKDTITKPFYVLENQTIFVPTGFTPNGDGINDYFKAEGVSLIDHNFHLTIYNRWGMLVFEGHHPDNAWDGTFKGQILPDDVYIWNLVTENLIGDIITMKGHITLLK